MEIITGYTGKPHVTSEQDRGVNIGVVGEGSYVLQTGMQLAAEVSSNNEIKIRDGVLMHQGCTASIKKNTYDSLTIINGSQGMKRIDLIVARYEKNQDNRTEGLDLKVIQGTPAESNPVVPEYTEGDIQAGDYVADMPMYQVIIDGLNITEVKKVFEVAPSIDAMKKEIAELNSKTTYALTPIWANPTYSITRIGNVIYIDYYCLVNGGVGGIAFGIAKLPSEISPNHTIKTQAWTASTNSQRHGASVEIKTDGQINFVAGDAFTEAGFTVSYPL